MNAPPSAAVRVGAALTGRMGRRQIRRRRWRCADAGWAPGTLELMSWLLAHRPADADDAVRVVIDAATSAEAIAELRAQIPADHKILYVMAADERAPVALA